MTDTYVRNGHVRLVDTPAQKVQAEWDGYKLASDAVESYDRPALQATAKELGIKANQSNAALAQQIAEFQPGDEVDPDADSGDDNPDAPDTVTS